MPPNNSKGLLNAFRQRLRQRAPQLSALLVFLISIPLLITLSAAAGFTVWKNVARGWQAPVFLQYGDGGLPHDEIQLAALSPLQPYDVTLHLNVPFCDSNLALGNFMTNLEVKTTSNKTITSVRRPAIVTAPVSGWWFYSSSSTPLTIPLLSAYAFGATRVAISLELGRQDRWSTLGNGQGRELRVISAELRGLVHHSGIRGIGTRFPILFGVGAGIAFLVISSSTLMLCLAPLLQTTISALPEPIQKGKLAVAPEKQKSAEFSPPPSYKPDSNSDDDRPEIMKRRRSRSLSIKQEEDSSAGPSVSLRRRMSRLEETSD